MSRTTAVFDQSRSAFVVILVLGIALRVATAFYLGEEVVALPGTFDQISYHNLALRVLDGHGFSFGEPWWPATRANEPTAHWSFLYTLYLTAVYAVSGSNPLVARLIQAVLAGALLPWLVYRLASRVFSSRNPADAQIGQIDGKRIGLVAAAIAAVYAYFVYYAAALMTESFYIMSILWSFDVAIQITQQRERIARRKWLELGLAMGTAVLLRQVFLLFIPFFLGWLWWSARPRLGKLLLPLVVIFLMMLPWMIRNYLAFDQFVLLNSNSGYAFFWGNHPTYGTTFIPILPSEEYLSLIPPELLHLNEAALDSALLRIALKEIITDPGRYLTLSLSRIPHYIVFWPMADSELPSNLSRVTSFGLFLPFMIGGLILTLRARFASLTERIASPLFLLYLFILVYAAIHILTWTLIRYRLPIDAVLLPFAAVAILKLKEWLRVRI